MKKLVLSIIGIAIAALFVWTGWFLYQKSVEPPEVFSTVKPFTASIVKKTVATGKIVPRREADIKSQVSGVVEKIFVQAGHLVAEGDLIARIRIIPNVERLNTAQSQVETSRINLKNAEREYARQRTMFDARLISELEFDRAQLDLELKREALSAAESNLAIIREGASLKSGQVSNLVRATAPGMILDVPVEEGVFVIETNTFNEGTTIATVADMQDLIFEGTVDESEVGKIREGMLLDLNVGALDDRKFKAVLEYIAPKGTDDNGTIKFQIRAAVELPSDAFLRAGYSANADIVLDRADQVLAIDESWLQFDSGRPYVEVETSPQQFEKRSIETGLSDGINIEVRKGITSDTVLKKS